MKPLNSNTKSCDKISSNCVIWQGDDIECISLCKGDTISDVVNKLATELCDIMDTVDVTNYDLSCFKLTTCSPEDFQALIQLLIERICKLEGCTGCIPDCNGNSVPPVTPGSGAGCPDDCIVPIALCFQTPNQFGDMITSMKLRDYVITIGNRLCGIVDQIATINLALTDLNNRVTILENTPLPVVARYRFVPKSVLPPVSTDIAAITEALEDQFTSLRSATGTPDEIYQAIVKQCNALSTAVALGPIGGSMGSIPGWFNSPANMASSIVNMWLTICDLRAAVGNIKLNSPDGCDGITIDLQLTFVGSTLKLFFTGTIPAGFQPCAPAGTMFTITDTSGGLVNIFVDVLTNMNNINGVAIDLTATPLNLLNNLTVVGTPCFHNNITNATCQSALQEVFYNTAICPILTLTPLFTSIGYSAPTVTGTANYTIEIWNGTGTLLITSTSETIVGPGTFAGSIGPLLSGTLYKVRLVITVGAVSTECAFQNSTTLGIPCLAPNTVVAGITVL